MKNLKAFSLCLTMLFALIGVAAQTPEWLWARSAGAPISEYEEANSIATDSSGNTYLTGRFQGTANFGTDILTSNGDSDIFVAKLDTAGNWLWAKSAGGIGIDHSNGIAVDNAGNVYLTGSFYDEVIFGITTLTYSGEDDIFVAKLDTAGNWLWAKRAGGSQKEEGFGIAVDSAANVYLTGYFRDTADFGNTSLTTSFVDVFVAKLDSAGDWLWAKKAGGTGRVEGKGIAVDSSANIYLTGSIFGAATFGSISLTSSGAEDIFVAKLDNSGNWLWATKAGAVDYDSGIGIAVDSASNVYLTGYFYWHDVTFGNTTLTNSGYSDIFVAKLDSAGNWLWATKAGGTEWDSGFSIAVDSAFNVYVTGDYRTAAIFGSTTLTSNGSADIFVGKLDSAGNWLWATKAGGTGTEGGRGIALDGASNVYLTGYFYGTATFGSISLTSNGSSDIFVAKLAASVGAEDDLNPPVIANSMSAWPNPFKQGTTLSIALEKPVASPSELRVSLYDLKGRRVRAFACDDKLTLAWDGRDDSGAFCPNGIYLVKLYSGARQLSSARLTLIK